MVGGERGDGWRVRCITVVVITIAIVISYFAEDSVFISGGGFENRCGFSVGCCENWTFLLRESCSWNAVGRGVWWVKLYIDGLMMSIVSKNDSMLES